MSFSFEDALLWLMNTLRTDVTDYCELETTEGGRTIVAQDGSLVSIVRFHGTKSVMGRLDFAAYAARIADSQTQSMKRPGHLMQFLFKRDLDATSTLRQTADSKHVTARELGMSIGDLIEEDVQKYSEYVYDEDCFIALWSRPTLLVPIELKLHRKELDEFRKTAKWPLTRDAQNILRPISSLMDRHLGFVSNFVDTLSSREFGCSLEWLDVAPALRAVRASVLPDWTGPRWRAAAPGLALKMPIRWKDNRRLEDQSELMYPTLQGQIMTGNAEIGDRKNPMLPDPTTVKVGNRVYAPVLVKNPPQEPQLFNSLFLSLNNASTVENGVTRAVPYCISIMLESDGMTGDMWKGIAQLLLAFTSESNRNANAARAALKLRISDGESVIKLKISAMTWAGCDPASVKELDLRKSKLIRAFESWGQLTVQEHTGNPMQAFQSCALALTYRHMGVPCPAPLNDVVGMLPLTRPASPFPVGSKIYRSLDGKIMRHQRFSSEQTAWLTLYAGKMGSGKSVTMNDANLEACLMPGIKNLPYIGIIDIGVSSKGFIDLVRDSLPKDRQHLALYKRLQNTERDAINPLDTPLGCREPLARDHAFMKNFISGLIMPSEINDDNIGSSAYIGLSAFVGRVLNVAFRNRSDRYEKSKPAEYIRGHNEIVDRALREIGFKAMAATTYWEVVDALFRHGKVYPAEIAQRLAVPTLSDLAAAAVDAEVKEDYAKSERGRELVDAFVRGIRESVENYPIFSKPTSFDIGSARVVALDLNDVAIKGGVSGQRQTALMYMIARQSFMKKVAFSEEDLVYFEPLYQDYYKKVVMSLMDENKLLAMDEVHRIGGHKGFMEQIFQDARESRKWNMEIALASQLLSDFGKDLVGMATSVFILDSGTEATRTWMRENLSLSDVEDNALQSHVRVNHHGATFLGRFITRSGTFSQLFTLSIGAMRLWALSTTAEDRKLRTLLYNAMPPQEARRLLAARFPSGSCKKHIETLKAEYTGNKNFIDEVEASLIEKLAQEMIEDHRYSALHAAA
jgi:intracellular multiplication protein IcmB